MSWLLAAAAGRHDQSQPISANNSRGTVTSAKLERDVPTVPHGLGADLDQLLAQTMVIDQCSPSLGSASVLKEVADVVSQHVQLETHLSLFLKPWQDSRVQLIAFLPSLNMCCSAVPR